MLRGPGAESTRVLVAAARARVLTLAERPAEAVTLLSQVLPDLGESPSAAYAVGLRALADALRAEGDRGRGSSTEEALREIARTLTGARGRRNRRAVEDLARGVVSRGSVTVAEQETAAWLAAERAAAHQAELDRRERARVEAERRAAEQAEAERSRRNNGPPNRPWPRSGRDAKPNGGPPPRRRSGWSGSVVARNAWSSTGWSGAEGSRTARGGAPGGRDGRGLGRGGTPGAGAAPGRAA